MGIELTHQKQAQPKLSTLRFNCFAAGSWIDNWIDNNAADRVLKLSVPLKRRQWYDGLIFQYQQCNTAIKSYPDKPIAKSGIKGESRIKAKAEIEFIFLNIIMLLFYCSKKGGGSKSRNHGSHRMK